MSSIEPQTYGAASWSLTGCRRIVQRLMAELRRERERNEALTEECRVLRLANTSLSRRLDAALGPAWEKREGETE